MSVSLYYTARRPQSITSQEQFACDRIIKQYNDEYPFGEPYEYFGIDNLEKLPYTEDEEGAVILNGSTKLPSNIFDVENIVKWWLKCLDEIAEALPGAQWDVHIDDIPIPC